MFYISLYSGPFGFQWFPNSPGDFDHVEDEEGLSIDFVFSGPTGGRDLCKLLMRVIREESLIWIRPTRTHLLLDLHGLRTALETKCKSSLPDDLGWLGGVAFVTPMVRYRQQESFGRVNVTTILSLTVYKEEYLMDHATKVFLSHKGPDKPRVLQFFTVLKKLGFDPWLDDDAMPAGTELHRGILQGFKDSCAAVFFITPNFRDEAYLRSEVNYAVQQKTKKGDRFAIITLVFDGARKDQVPDLLHSYVWKEPSSELDALTEIVRALPITLGLPTWRPGL